MSTIISTSIMVVILGVIIVMAVRNSISHMKGEGGCCGGGGELKAERKKLEGKKIAQIKVFINGMHCDNCKNSVERAINDIDGAVAKVNLKKNYAIISMDREIEPAEFVKKIEALDFQVTKMQTVPLP